MMKKIIHYSKRFNVKSKIFYLKCKSCLKLQVFPRFQLIFVQNSRFFCVFVWNFRLYSKFLVFPGFFSLNCLIPGFSRIPGFLPSVFCLKFLVSPGFLAILCKCFESRYTNKSKSTTVFLHMHYYTSTKLI